jgi:hypothetical protein
VLGALGVQPVHAIMNAPENASMYLALSSADGYGVSSLAAPYSGCWVLALGVQPVHAIMNAPESVSMYLALSSADGYGVSSLAAPYPGCWVLWGCNRFMQL